MMVLQWLDTAWRVVLGGFFALLPGLIFWLVVLVLFLLVRWLAFGHASPELAQPE